VQVGRPNREVRPLEKLGAGGEASSLKGSSTLYLSRGAARNLQGAIGGSVRLGIISYTARAGENLLKTKSPADKTVIHRRWLLCDVVLRRKRVADR